MSPRCCDERSVDESEWREATQRLHEGEATLRQPLGRRVRRPHGAIDAGRRRARRAAPRLPGGRISFRRRRASARDPAGARDRRSLWPACDRRAGPSSLARSWDWPLRAPLGAAQVNDAPPPKYEFLAAEGRGLHQIPVGPVHAGIIEPGHFRFHASGETVVRLEARLGYVHKGVNALMRGRESRARRGAGGRASAATRRSPIRSLFPAPSRRRSGGKPPPRAVWLRAADGGTGAARQSFRRHRRDLQRRLVLADARPLRHLARAGVANLRGRVRPSPDDGQHRSRRRQRRSRPTTDRRRSARSSQRSATCFRG